MECILSELGLMRDALALGFLLYLPFLADRCFRKGQDLKRRKQ